MSASTLVTRPAAAGRTPVVRRLGRAIAAAARAHGVTPPALAIAAAAAAGFGIVLLAAVPASLAVGAGVTALLGAGLVLGAAADELAADAGRGATVVAVDRVVGAAKPVALHLAVLITAYRSLVPAELPHLLLLPIAFAVVAAAGFALVLLRETLGSPARRHAAGERAAVLDAVLAASFLLLGLAPAFLVVYGVLLVASAVTLTVAPLTRYPGLRRIDALV